MIDRRKRGQRDLGRCDRCSSALRGFATGYCPWCNRGGSSNASDNLLAQSPRPAGPQTNAKAAPHTGLSGSVVQSSPSLLWEMAQGLVPVTPGHGLASMMGLQEQVPQECPCDDSCYEELSDHPWDEAIQPQMQTDEADDVEFVMSETEAIDWGASFHDQWEIDSDGHLHERSRDPIRLPDDNYTLEDLYTEQEIKDMQPDAAAVEPLAVSQCSTDSDQAVLEAVLCMEQQSASINTTVNEPMAVSPCSTDSDEEMLEAVLLFEQQRVAS